MGDSYTKGPIPELSIDDVFTNIECGYHDDLKCLCPPEVRTKVIGWFERWGSAGVLRILARLCLKCAISPQPPPKDEGPKGTVQPVSFEPHDSFTPINPPLPPVTPPVVTPTGCATRKPPIGARR